ncbi:hypothetical protein AB1286_17885 [Trinickia sp. NRRL B-1857]|uniref:hypothetical protein n=1 Tax=Trinickia sp. NRRL B-1857 TaxID=3162879 RepID=UPI003D280751
MANFKYFTFDASEVVPGAQSEDGAPSGFGYVNRELTPGATIRYDYGLKRYTFEYTYLTYNTSLFGGGSVPPGGYGICAQYAEDDGRLLVEDKWVDVNINDGNWISFANSPAWSQYLNLEGRMCDDFMIGNQISQNLFCNLFESNGINPKFYTITSLKNFSKISNI